MKEKLIYKQVELQKPTSGPSGWLYKPPPRLASPRLLVIATHNGSQKAETIPSSPRLAARPIYRLLPSPSVPPRPSRLLRPSPAAPLTRSSSTRTYATEFLEGACGRCGEDVVLLHHAAPQGPLQEAQAQSGQAQEAHSGHREGRKIQPRGRDRRVLRPRRPPAADRAASAFCLGEVDGNHVRSTWRMVGAQPRLR